jgi:hypothetical protein
MGVFLQTLGVFRPLLNNSVEAGTVFNILFAVLCAGTNWIAIAIKRRCCTVSQGGKDHQL